MTRLKTIGNILWLVLALFPFGHGIVKIDDPGMADAPAT